VNARWLVASIVLSGCAGSSPTVAPIVVPAQPPQPPQAAAPVVRLEPAAARARVCNVRLVAGKIRTRESCFLDERISRGPATLTVPCEGADGPAEVAFEEQRFVGQVKDGVVSLDTHAELDWNVDGCHWENDQHIEGTVGAGTLRWTYTEAPTRGVNCAGTCKGSADIKVEQ
jgi:hypothetical protein